MKILFQILAVLLLKEALSQGSGQGLDFSNGELSIDYQLGTYMANKIIQKPPYLAVKS